ncbi:Microcystin-dependent protein [Paenibacillus catalpae]|uniref:Microcystin-dependent protein n=1 Tax=Paenibacillus catalpae TaxID=1045775 RepID=A0A1I2AWU5_9BACL|nr:tail fiber protein [Paenibacillus catalpae]SFE47453.1 Microcystin-dependent protein [Paenibacillus catalpae]
MSDQYIGEIRMFGGNFPPLGWEFCNGQLLPISQFDALFMLIGTTYGGDGVSTFALPDLQGRIPVHMGRNNATGTTYVLGQKAGTETVTLTANQMPAHTHIPNSSNLEGQTNSPENAYWASSSKIQYADTAPNATLNPAAIGAAGGNQPHDNMMPYGAVSFIISTEGIFPQQN